MLISNYGLFWQRKYVDFGHGDNKGTLLGKTNKKKSFLVDFREQIGIYVLYDKEFVPIYVGQAGDGNAALFKRLKHHTTDDLCDRWEYFTWFGLRRVNAGGRLAACDSMKTMELKLNKRVPRVEDPAEEYHQAVDENVAEMSIEDLTAGNEERKNRKRAMDKRLKKKSK